MRAPGIALVLASGCALSGGADQTPAPPTVEGDVPAIGKKVDFELTDSGSGASARLAGIPGRVTVICAFHEPAELEPCRSALGRFQDRVTVAGIDTADPAVPPPAPFRIFLDPGGARLAQGLQLPRADRVLVLDRQGRVRAVLPPEATEKVLQLVGDLGG